MMIVLVARAAATAVAATLALSSSRNMLQTFQIPRAHQETMYTEVPSIPPSLHWYVQHASDPTSTAASVVNDLERFRREELLEIFISCQPPIDPSEIEGSWNGALLENNGFVMVRFTFYDRGALRRSFAALLTISLHLFRLKSLLF
jgi:hypothetical protein